MVWFGLAALAVLIVAMQRVVRLRVGRRGLIFELRLRSSFRYVSLRWRGGMEHVRIHRDYGGRMRGRPLPPPPLPPPGDEPPGAGVREPRPPGDRGPAAAVGVRLPDPDRHR